MMFNAFAPIFEIFVGIGFTFFVITKVEGFLQSMLGVEARADEPILDTIKSNIRWVQELSSEAMQLRQTDISFELLKSEKTLVNLIENINQKRFQILHNARFYFLSLGFQSLVYLFFCGIEHYCLNHTTETLKEKFYCAVLLSTVFFVLINLLLVFFTFQPKKDDPIIWKVFFTLALLIIVIQFSIYFSSNFFFAQKDAIVFSALISLGFPFILLLGRHEKFKFFIKHNDFNEKVEQLRIEIAQINRRLKNIKPS